MGYALFNIQKEGTDHEKSIISDLGACIMPVPVCLWLWRRQPRTTEDINNGENGEVDNGNSENNNADTDCLIRGGIINAAVIRECVEIVELTAENWKEHFKVYHYSYSYDEEKVETDAFGEIVSSEIVTHSGEGYAFGAGNDKYHWYDNVIIELQDKTTGELSIYQFDSNANDVLLEEDFNLDNYECTRIKGSIYYWNIPIGDIPLGATFMPGFENEAMAPYPWGWSVHAGTNAINYAYMDFIFS